MSEAAPPTALTGDGRWRALCALLGLTPVVPLLAWMYGIGSYTAYWLLVATPGMLLLAVIAAWPGHLRRHPALRTAFISGAVGGILATMAYDVVRIPFVVTGLRLFTPIDSFGMLMLNANHSSHLTEFAAWSAHFSDGVGFGVAYSMVALGRRWWWGPLWGVALEASTLITPYTQVYGLAGHWDLIALALGAHLVYGTPLGLIVRKADTFTRGVDEMSRFVAPAFLAICVAAMALWQQPWSTAADLRSDSERAAGVEVVVNNGKFVPEWTRVRPGECVLVANHDATAYTATGIPDGPALPPGTTTKICPPASVIYRVKLSNVPFSGGLIMVDAHYF